MAFHHWARPQTINTLLSLIGEIFAVCLLMCQSFDLQPVFCCFFVVIREIPLCFLSPTMHRCLYQAAQEVGKCLDVKPLHTFQSPSFSLFLPSFHFPAVTKFAAMKFLHNMTSFLLFFYVFSPAGESARFGEGNISWRLCVMVCNTQIELSRCVS